MNAAAAKRHYLVHKFSGTLGEFILVVQGNSGETHNLLHDYSKHPSIFFPSNNTMTRGCGTRRTLANLGVLKRFYCHRVVRLDRLEYFVPVRHFLH